MFTGSKYITQGIKKAVPPFMQNILWYMIETMEAQTKDYLQVFHLSSVTEDGNRKQKVVHTQEEPIYRKEYIICTKQIVCGQVFVIDDKTHCTMLLAEEY